MRLDELFTHYAGNPVEKMRKTEKDVNAYIDATNEYRAKKDLPTLRALQRSQVKLVADVTIK